MIRLDISTLLFIYILCTAVVILAVWIASGYRRGIKRISQSGKTEFIWRCTVCLHEYIDSRDDDITVCPLCGSYNKREASQLTMKGR